MPIVIFIAILHRQ